MGTVISKVKIKLFNIFGISSVQFPFSPPKKKNTGFWPLLPSLSNCTFLLNLEQYWWVYNILVTTYLNHLEILMMPIDFAMIIASLVTGLAMIKYLLYGGNRFQIYCWLLLMMIKVWCHCCHNWTIVVTASSIVAGGIGHWGLLLGVWDL